MRIRIGLSILISTTACSSGVDTSINALDAVCLDDPGQAPAGEWMCGEERTVECTSPAGTPVDHLYVVNDSGPSCANTQLSVSDPGPFALGDHVILVTRTSTDGTGVACEATLHVVDTTPPVLTAKSSGIWPPNHKMHRFTPSDCVDVEDSCEDQVRLTFTHATSDEPFDANGDGNHQPDIVLGCDSIELRSERQGGSDGRVYTLGVRAEDASGNVSVATCTVAVTHDRSGRDAIESGEAERVGAPASCN